MKTEKQISKVLEVQTEEFNYGEGDNKQDSFLAHEFENGIILVEGFDTHDWFFLNRNDISACGQAQVIDIVETGETKEWDPKAILESIQGSVKEFSADAVPANHIQLWR